MDYKTFQEELLAELRDFYGEDADVTAQNITDDSERVCGEIKVSMCQKAGSNVSLTVNISALYEKISLGIMDMNDCMESIYRELEGRINSNDSSILECGTDGNLEEKSREI